MEALIIEATQKTPRVILDPVENHYEISGLSLPENVVKTYDPIIKWIEENMGNIKSESIIFKFKLDYLNSASAKMISLILTKLEEFYKSDLPIEVEWYYSTDDDDIRSEGEIYSMLKKVPIKLIEVASSL
ncbi:MAG TPA: DUF1987 domain-containing protein [Salinivirgaceae bacterium]|nr:DUF1987 domain-containing protein [Salinivirgaceae bacterium]